MTPARARGGGEEPAARLRARRNPAAPAPPPSSRRGREEGEKSLRRVCERAATPLLFLPLLPPGAGARRGIRRSPKRKRGTRLPSLTLRAPTGGQTPPARARGGGEEPAAR